jgi:hypothetical protein
MKMCLEKGLDFLCVFMIYIHNPTFGGKNEKGFFTVFNHNLDGHFCFLTGK